VQQNKETITDRVLKVVHEVLRVPEEKLKLDSRFKEDLGADSLDTVTLLMALEEEFEGDIADEEAEKLVTVGDAVLFIQAKAEEQINQA
jgi:acyl carrier protein